MTRKGPVSSDDIVTELQHVQADRDVLRARGRTLQAQLEAALIAEGKALSPLASADLRNKEARDAIRAQLDALDEQEG